MRHLLAGVRAGHLTTEQVARELGITAGMLLKWDNKYQVVEPGTAKASLEPSDLEAAKREIRRLERELQEIAEEREILKKVVNIFSRKGA